MPAYEQVIETSSDTIEITVIFEPVPPGFAWGSLEASGALGELIGVLPADGVDEDGRPFDTTAVVLADLRIVEEGSYSAEVVVGPGEWAVVPWPLVPNYTQAMAHPGTPWTEFVSVGLDSAWLPVAAVAAGAAVVGLVWLGRRRTLLTDNRQH